jgi:membrane protease YdiL (CAAX protease family)
MNKNLKAALDILLFVVVFFLIQYVITVLTGIIGMLASGSSWKAAGEAFIHGNFNLTSNMLVIATVLSSVFTACLFAKLRWTPVSRHWLREKPVGVLFWAALAALGSILPSEWLVEQMQHTMPEAQEKLFEQIMAQPIGYISIGIVAPLAEEMVFRGAILRKLLGRFGEKWHWVAILISAVIFGAVHGNIPQFVHAALIGLLLGWMYYRTGSILPGVLLHWVNNTVAYVMFNAMPQMADGKLIDIFHGSTKMVALSVIFSLFILIPSILQLNARMKK